MASVEGVVRFDWGHTPVFVVFPCEVPTDWFKAILAARSIDDKKAVLLNAWDCHDGCKDWNEKRYEDWKSLFKDAPEGGGLVLSAAMVAAKGMIENDILNRTGEINRQKGILMILENLWHQDGPLEPFKCILVVDGFLGDATACFADDAEVVLVDSILGRVSYAGTEWKKKRLSGKSAMMDHIVKCLGVDLASKDLKSIKDMLSEAISKGYRE
ncbi:hypothetical protein EV217_5113 [Phyllobacterium myrsinacearum]|uniref:hypothetical protein n=1 Tax=Phyllobacterium myrsinacearum TaxID=28101 RepID=UPI0010291ED3|nr:hypothetical protein [Phyllobacterium myrsinacearum]RZS76882.1 hypothetical protein EV217_5113 [Phyllobacterium myrsinacearum]